MLLEIMENRSVLALGSLQGALVLFPLCFNLVFEGTRGAGFERR